MKTIKLVVNQKVPENYTGIVKWHSIYYDFFHQLVFYKNSLVHRENGPAYITHRGKAYWYFDNKRYSLEEWFDLLTPEQKIKALYNPENWYENS